MRLTIKEVMQALLDGKKLTVYNPTADQVIYLSSDGHIIDEADGTACVLAPFRTYKIYEEPKKKKELWQVATRSKYEDDISFYVQSTLCTEKEINMITGDVIKIAGPFEVEE